MTAAKKKTILKLIDKAFSYGEIKMLVNAAGVFPSRAPIEAVLKVDWVYAFANAGRKY